MTRKIACGLATIEPGAGGISSVSRMVLASLSYGGYRVTATSLLDDGTQMVAGVRVDGCGGRKPLFAARLLASAVRNRLFFYDHAGMARVHSILPAAHKMVFIHGVEVWGVGNPVYARSLRGSKLIIANSHHTLGRAQQSIGPLPQAEICWLATERDDAPAPAPPPQTPTVLILGRIVSSDFYKGHRELVEAWPRVVAAAPGARLVIAGGGDGLPALRALVAASPAAGSIEVKGFVPEAELDALWRSASVFAMPSRNEGFGLVYIDAMRYGVPVIASTYDAGAEVNVDGVTGFNVSLDTPDMLADRLIRLLTSAELRAQMGAAGRQRWLDHFRFSAFRDRFLAFLDPVATSTT